MKRILIVASAPKQYCAKVIEKHLHEEHEIAILVNKKTAMEYSSLFPQVKHVYSVSGYINSYSISTWLSLLLFRPSKVVVCVENNYFHRNVVNSLSAIRSISFLKFKIFRCQRYVESPDDWPFVSSATFYTFHLIFFSAFLFACYKFPDFAFSVFLVAIIYEFFVYNIFSYGNHSNDNPDSKYPINLNLSIPFREYTPYFFSRLVKQDIHLLKTKYKLSWTCTTDQDGMRITSSPERSHNSKDNEIIFLGCSQTFGHGVSDNKTFAWKIQEMFPQYKVTNLSRSGASANEMLLRLMNYDMKNVKLVIFCHFYHHVYRNTASISWLHGNKDIQAAVVKSCGLKQLGKISWIYFPYRRFALFRFLEYQFNFLISYSRSRKIVMEKTSHAIVESMRDFCQKSNTKFLVCNIDNDMSVVDFLYKGRFNWLFGVSMESLSATGETEYTLDPIDGHINEKAHEEIANKLSKSLDDLLTTGTSFPNFEEAYDRGFRVEERSQNRSIYPVF